VDVKLRVGSISFRHREVELLQNIFNNVLGKHNLEQSQAGIGKDYPGRVPDEWLEFMREVVDTIVKHYDSTPAKEYE
jgi:hypothetical protein